MAQTHLPKYVTEVIERVAFVPERIRKSTALGVSQRLPISATEIVVPNAERRPFER